VVFLRDIVDGRKMNCAKLVFLSEMKTDTPINHTSRGAGTALPRAQTAYSLLSIVITTRV